MILPAWLDQEAWEGWCEIRSAMKRIPFTERAKNIALRRLEEWHELGYDCTYILDQATLSGWRGLWLPQECPRRALEQKPVLSNQQIDLLNGPIRTAESGAKQRFLEKFKQYH